MNFLKDYVFFTNPLIQETKYPTLLAMKMQLSRYNNRNSHSNVNLVFHSLQFVLRQNIFHGQKK